MSLSQQVTELTAAKDRIATETTAAGERVSALVQSLRDKIEELGEVDPDLSPILAEFDAVAEKLKAIGVDQTTPEPSPVEPTS